MKYIFKLAGVVYSFTDYETIWNGVLQKKIELKSTILRYLSVAAILDAILNMSECLGLTTPNASPIEIHVKCLNSTGRFYFFLPSPLSSAAYHNEAWTVNFQKQLR